ncbi:MAG: replication-relaxation family protein [Thermaerobacter sp.]|nr:replication-relaxation family protein [Thermaerobacter sp.]
MPPWQDVLRLVGVLTDDQLFTGWRTTIAEIQQTADVVVYQGAIWDRARFGRGARMGHRVAVSQTYLDLRPELAAWHTVPAGRVQADALVLFAGTDRAIPIEVDTGKENRRQWLAKLDGYRGDPPPGLIVVAQGQSLRLARIQAWCEQSGLEFPIQCRPARGLASDAKMLRTWAGTLPATVVRSRGEAESRPIRYLRADGSWTETCPRSHWGAREIRAGYDVRHLLPDKTPGPRRR